MDKEYSRWEEEDETEPTDKFDECYMCIHRICERTCNDCDNGEFFDEEDPDDLEDILV